MDKTILIIEDDAGIARLLELELTHAGYKTEWESDGGEGLQRAKDKDYDLIILDVMLPSLNGIEVLRRLKKVKNTPVIILTARNQVVDKVEGLDLGASDYITKPFATPELLARVRVNIKKNAAGESLVINGVTIYPEARQVYVDDQLIELTKREFDMLLYLCENKGKVISREKLLEKVWGFDFYGTTNVVDVYACYLRTKIDEKYKLKLIETVRGSGYIIR